MIPKLICLFLGHNFKSDSEVRTNYKDIGTDEFWHERSMFCMRCKRYRTVKE
jgi:hypothetical protein